MRLYLLEVFSRFLIAAVVYKHLQLILFLGFLRSFLWNFLWNFL